MSNIVHKFRECGNDRLVLCGAGATSATTTGGRYVVWRYAQTEGDVPVIFDVTMPCSVEIPATASGGRRFRVVELARAGMATGLTGLGSTDPDKALCDGPSVCRYRLATAIFGTSKSHRRSRQRAATGNCDW